MTDKIPDPERTEIQSYSAEEDIALLDMVMNRRLDPELLSAFRVIPDEG